MKGLILKDLFLIKGNIKTLLIILFGLCIMLLNNMTSMTFILPLFCVMLCISTFNYDDFNHWNAYAITLPNGRKNAVKSKYLATIILISISTILSLIISYVIGFSKGNFDLELTLSNLIGSLASVLLIMSLMYPLIYKFGSEKGRLFLFVIVLGIALIGGAISTILEKKGIDLSSLLSKISIKDFYLITIGIVLMIIIIIGSFLISKKIYQKKEF